MSDNRIKVTDKRMFTPDGELREEFRHLDEGGARESEERAAETPVEAPPPAPPPEVEPRGEDSRARVEIPRPDDGIPAPTFFDLVSMIAEPVAVYLGEMKLPDGGSAENLDMARLYIDLLDVLRQKTAGNLDVQEMSFLEELIYQLRLRYVQKRG